MNKLSSIFAKLKSIKHIEVILAALFGLITILVFFSAISAGTETSGNHQNTYYTSESGYVEGIEGKLSAILSSLDGAGLVEVMLMAENEEDGNKNSSATPKIVAAVIVAEGASDIAVKVSITRAVQTLLRLDASNIEILQRS